MNCFVSRSHLQLLRNLHIHRSFDWLRSRENQLNFFLSEAELPSRRCHQSWVWIFWTSWMFRTSSSSSSLFLSIIYPSLSMYPYSFIFFFFVYLLLVLAFRVLNIIQFFSDKRTYIIINNCCTIKPDDDISQKDLH